MSIIKLHHTSPRKIETIKTTGLFGSHVCFANETYCTGNAEVEYILEVDESNIINASSLAYQDISDTVNQGIEYFKSVYDLELDEDEMIDLISENSNYTDYEELESEYDACYYIQNLTAEAARECGYSIVRGIDEQGSVWLVDLNVWFEKMVIVDNE